MSNELERLVRWYRDRCNGDWEHQHGIRIGTLDNPGWSLDVDLSETPLSGKEISLVRSERGEDDWMFYEVKKNVFEGNCGPGNLQEMIRIFLELANVD